jgi:hypothetical protein
VATYYTSVGGKVRTFAVAPSSRHTVGLFSSTEGAGPGYYPLGIVIGSDQTEAVTVNPNTRLTVPLVGTTSGIGPDQVILGLVVSSTNAVPILVEKPTYSANTSSYGATDTLAYSPASF